MSGSILFFLALLMMFPVMRTADEIIPAIFVFGDSTVDVGNNNFVPTTKYLKANFRFNGVDFPDGNPTGRFSNSHNVADFVAKHLGFKRSPPSFLSLSLPELQQYMFTGINFASGGSGILNHTGDIYGGAISFEQQLKYFAMVQNNLTERIGPVLTGSLLSKSFFLLSSGSNDILETASGFSAPLENSTEKDNFILNVTSTYQQHLRTLYDLGARKLGIISSPNVGCCPSQRAKNNTGGCLEDLNQLSQMFYTTMEVLLSNLSSQLVGMKYSLGNSYNMVDFIFQDPSLSKFTNLTSACCGSGPFNGAGQCDEDADLCFHRRDYLFWDWYHPTEAASSMAADALFCGLDRFVVPVNFSRLALY